MKHYQVTEIELYLSEVGDGDPDLQFTPQEEYVMHQRCLGRWTAYNEDDLRNRIFDFIGYPVETIKVTDAQHHMLQVLVMFAHENEVPEQEGWNIQTYNNLFDEVMK